LYLQVNDIYFTPSDRIQQQPDGSLHIKDVGREDAGEYSCSVEKDSITHHLTVLGGYIRVLSICFIDDEIF
jgi:hypothetical protein